MSLGDGVRLATRVLRPLGRERSPALLLRTPHAPRGRPGLLLPLARLLAEAGYAVVVQEVRGRHGSEGRFAPFAQEVEDGAQAAAWVAEQPFCDGRLGLLGFSYAAYAAWAALARSPAPVQALVVGTGARDVRAAYYPGGAFALEAALSWSAGIGEREEVPRRRLDLGRAYAFRPLREADRVALCERPWYRDWLAHPRPDAWWQSFLPELPAAPPAALLLGGFHDPFLGAQLDDYAALREAAGRAAVDPPRLVLGPWTHGPGRAAARRPREAWFARVAALEVLAFLDAALGEGRGGAPRRARLYQSGAGRWLDLAGWPPPEAAPHTLFLRSGGQANSLAGDGRLEPEPAAAEPPDRFTYDPDDPVPSCGGALLAAGGTADQRTVEARGDVLCYTSAPLPGDLDAVGPVRALLFVSSSAPDSDFTAKLVDVAGDGRALNVCEGIARARWRAGGAQPQWLEADAPTPLEIDLWGAAHRFRAGHRLRLEVSSSSFPRFDRSPNSREDPALARSAVPAQQVVWHGGEHPSQLVLFVLRA